MASSFVGLSVDELIAKGIAPVSRQYWKPVEPRQEVAAVGSSQIPEAGKSKKPDKKSRKQFKKVPACECVCRRNAEANTS